MRKKITPLVFILATVVAPCNAQTESALDSMQHLQEVTISTTRIPELKSNAAATVTIIDNKQIEAMSKIAPDMSHLLGLLTPGMALSSNTTSSRAQSLRGRSALILIDGICFFMISTIRIWDLRSNISSTVCKPGSGCK